MTAAASESPGFSGRIGRVTLTLQDAPTIMMRVLDGAQSGCQAFCPMRRGRRGGPGAAASQLTRSCLRVGPLGYGATCFLPVASLPSVVKCVAHG